VLGKDVWCRRLRESLEPLFDGGLWCSSASKKHEVPHYRVYACNNHVDCGFKMKAVILAAGQQTDVCWQSGASPVISLLATPDSGDPSAEAIPHPKDHPVRLISDFAGEGTRCTAFIKFAMGIPTRAGAAAATGDIIIFLDCH
ncbi:hypothetical protein FOZ63_008266, partial [Perkinsus olseni]